MKVLIIETDGVFAASLRTAFQAHGYRVAITGDGAQAVELARAEKPAAVVLAVELGDKLTGGFSWCNKFKRDEALRDVPLALVSSLATRDTFEQHKKLKTRADVYLLKPFEPAELLNRLNTWLPMDGPVAGSTAALADELLGRGDAVGVEELETVEEDAISEVEEADDAIVEEVIEEAELAGLDRTVVARVAAPREPTPGPGATSLEIAELKGRVAELEDRLESAVRGADERTAELAARLKSREAAAQAAEQRADAASAQVRKLEATLAVLREEAGHVPGLHERLERLRGEKTELAGELVSARAEASAFHGRIESLEEELAAVTERAASFDRACDELRAQLEEARSSAARESQLLRERIAELETEVGRGEERVLKAYQKIKNDQKQLERIRKALAVVQEIVDEVSAD